MVGLRVTGEALVGHFTALGHAVTAADDRPDSETFAAHAARARALGATVLERPDVDTLRRTVAGAVLVVPSPGIPPHHRALEAARELAVPIRSEIDIAAEVARDAGRPVIAAVTGTNGKTSVTTLATAILEESGIRAGAAGNVGRALIEAVSDPDLDVVVAEVSSFQLEYTDVFQPRVAVLLNVADDHLDWHGSAAAYAAAKARVFSRQEAGDLAIVNADDDGWDPATRPGHAAAIAFSTAADAPAGSYRVVDGALVDPHDAVIARCDELIDPLPHDLANALAATAVAVGLGGTLAAARATLRGFSRLPHRVALVGEAMGVRYYDDSKATNPHATLHALGSFPHAVLIAGGVNTGLDLGALRAGADHIRAVVAIGAAAPEIEAAFSGLPVPVVTADSMTAAVTTAADLADRGDVVLLSPACASFDWYRDYAERGDDFARVVGELVGDRGALG